MVCAVSKGAVSGFSSFGTHVDILVVLACLCPLADFLYQEFL